MGCGRGCGLQEKGMPFLEMHLELFWRSLVQRPWLHTTGAKLTTSVTTAKYTDRSVVRGSMNAFETTVTCAPFRFQRTEQQRTTAGGYAEPVLEESTTLPGSEVKRFAIPHHP